MPTGPARIERVGAIDDPVATTTVVAAPLTFGRGSHRGRI